MTFEIEQPAADLAPSTVVGPTKPRLLGVLGPGLITGDAARVASSEARPTRRLARNSATRSLGR